MTLTGRTRSGFFLAFGLLALAAVATVPLTPFPGQALVKALPLACLAILTIFSAQDWHDRILAIGLGLASLGDFILGWENPEWFLYGAGTFLAANLCFIVALSSPLRWARVNILRAVIVVIFWAWVAVQLAPAAGPNLPNMLIYGCVLVVLVVLAALQSRPHNLVYFGAMLFFFSDLLVFWFEYVQPWKYKGLPILIPYYSGLLLIVIGRLKR